MPAAAFHATHRNRRRRQAGGQRTRHFFSGLTEEVRKVSVGTHADDSFGFLEKITGDGGMSEWNSGSITSVYDEELHAYVAELPAGTSARSGQHHEWNPGGSTTWGITDKRVLSAWVKVTGDQVHFTVVMRNTQGETRSHLYRISSGPPSTGMDVPYSYASSGTRAIFHTNLRRDGQWRRLERDLIKDFEAAWPGETFQEVAGLTLSAQSSNAQLWLANVRLSNSMTVEKNVLGAGQIGHILQNRTIDTAASYAITDRWFHYDQVGSVTATTDADGALVAQRHADAFGNTLEDWETGLWTASSGWGHNTKEHNAATGLVYMYQRHYLPETGTFLSTAPYPPMMEHEYTFAAGNPVGMVDVDGRAPWAMPGHDEASNFSIPRKPRPRNGRKIVKTVDDDCLSDCVGPHQRKYANARSAYHGGREANSIIKACTAKCTTRPNVNFFEPNCATECDAAVIEVEARLGEYGWSCHCFMHNPYPFLDETKFGVHFLMKCIGPNGEQVTHNPTIGTHPLYFFPW